MSYVEDLISVLEENCQDLHESVHSMSLDKDVNEQGDLWFYAEIGNSDGASVDLSLVERLSEILGSTETKIFTDKEGLLIQFKLRQGQEADSKK